MNEFTNASEAVLEQLNERKYLLNKIIASYAEKMKKDDFWYYWYANARNHYIRKARKIKAAIDAVEAENKALEDALEVYNAEVQRRESEAKQEEAAPISCGDANNSCEGQTECDGKGACAREGVVSEVGDSAQAVAGITPTEDKGTAI